MERARCSAKGIEPKKMTQIFKFSGLESQNKIVHGFSTRYYGNMSSYISDGRRNLKNFGMDLGIDPLDIVDMEQVHGTNIEWVTEENRGWRLLQTDGMITADKHVFLAVKCADCFPVFIIDSKLSVVSAIHAGWRGVYDEIIDRAVDEFEKKGIRPQDLSVFIGPGIRECCYEVSAERGTNFRMKFGNSDEYVIERQDKTYISLPKFITKQLVERGINKSEVEDCGVCTYETEDFYSFRKEGKDSGRFVGIIGLL